jgi:glycosyltransferase involved in cell wall biosynthesis
MDRSRVALVIPALNEAGAIGAVISGVNSLATVIVVDDGSTDETSAIAGVAGAHVVRHERNRGYDQSLESGFRRASELGCLYMITMDGDGQHSPALVTKFIDALERGADVVIGIRDHKQRFSEQIFAFVTSKLWGVFDPLCGMKAYRAEVYRELGHFDSYRSIGTELALYAARRGRTIVQIGIQTRPRSGASRFGRSISANFRIFRALLCALRPL